jgi:hypothetical protein
MDDDSSPVCALCLAAALSVILRACAVRPGCARAACAIYQKRKIQDTRISAHILMSTSRLPRKGSVTEMRGFRLHAHAVRRA